ncbi:MAG: hypothetical protein ACRD1Z_00490, partial [Vicinamibacteria bacterium]
MSLLEIGVTAYGAGVLLLLALRPSAGMFLLIPLIPFIFYLPTSEIRGLNGWTVLILAAFGATLFRLVLLTGRSGEKNPIVLPLVLFIVMILFSLGVSHFTLKNPTAYSTWIALIDIKRFLLFLLLFFIYFYNARTRADVYRCVDFLVIGIALEAVFAL